MQAQRDVYQAQVRDLIINRHVPHAKDPGKDNIVMIIEKNTTPPRMMSFMSIPTTLPGYNDDSLTQKDAGLKHNTSIIDL